MSHRLAAELQLVVTESWSSIQMSYPGKVGRMFPAAPDLYLSLLLLERAVHMALSSTHWSPLKAMGQFHPWLNVSEVAGIALV